MEEIRIYLDKGRKNEVKESIEFEKVVAGETTTRKIYILNATDYYLNIKLKLEGKYVKISKTVGQIGPRKTEEVEFKFTPRITTMVPITAQLKIKIDYVVR